MKKTTEECARKYFDKAFVKVVAEQENAVLVLIHEDDNLTCKESLHELSMISNRVLRRFIKNIPKKDDKLDNDIAIWKEQSKQRYHRVFARYSKKWVVEWCDETGARTLVPDISVDLECGEIVCYFNNKTPAFVLTQSIKTPNAGIIESSDIYFRQNGENVCVAKNLDIDALYAATNGI